MSSGVLWLLVWLPLGAGTALAVGGGRAGRVAAPVAVGVALVEVGLAIAAAWTRPAVEAPFLEGIPAGLAVDGLSAILVLTATGTALLVLVFSAGELGNEEARGRFFGLMLVFLGAMLVTVTATSLLPLLMAWEAMGATSYALIGFWWREQRRVDAANTAFLTTRAADLGLYVAAGAALAGGVGGLELAQLPQASSPWLGVASAGVVVAALGKSAQLPFSFWLSRAMEGPSPVSALLHSATMVAAGGYLLLRLGPLLQAVGWAGSLVAWVGASTALVLGLVAIGQSDLKQLLAASTAAQIGFVVLAAGVAGELAGTAHLVAHAATKSLLFLAAGAWLTALGTKQLGALRGAARAHPVVGITFTVGAVALAGLPPLSLWLTKDEVLAAARERSPALYAVGLAGSVAAAGYAARALASVWSRRDERVGAYDSEREGTRHVGRLAQAPLCVLAAGAALGGALVLPPLVEPVRRTLGAEGEPVSSTWELLLSGGLAVVAVLAVFRFGVPLSRRARAAAEAWLGLERAVHLAVVRPTLALARTAGAFDDRVLARGMWLTGPGGRRLAGLAEGGLERGLLGLVGGVVHGTARLGTLARRPQTGLVHQYYAQAATVLGALALLFALVR